MLIISIKTTPLAVCLSYQDKEVAITYNTISPILTECSNQYQHNKQNTNSYTNANNSNDILKNIGKKLYQSINQPHAQELLHHWLNNPQAGYYNLCVVTQNTIPTAEESLLLSLPWEILVTTNTADRFLADNQAIVYNVIRCLGRDNLSFTPPNTRYNCLSLAFMASDPRGADSLFYEKEERSLLAYTYDNDLRLIPNDSGNLTLLNKQLSSIGGCDMVHLTCHGGQDKMGFYLQMESEHGIDPIHARVQDVRQLQAQSANLFISACDSGCFINNKSMLTDLIYAGFANVIGWDGKVIDDDAIKFSDYFYQALKSPMTVPQACAKARYDLLSIGGHHWHLARTYIGKHGGAVLVDKNTNAQRQTTNRISCYKKLDTLKQVVPVATTETFVGRRKECKQALQTLKSRNYAGILFYGIGGAGKSSVSARILDRLSSTHDPVVIYERYTEIDILYALQQPLANKLKSIIDAQSIINNYIDFLKTVNIAFAEILKELLNNYFSDYPIILVIDDIEQHLLKQDENSEYIVLPEYRQTLLSVVHAFDELRIQANPIQSSYLILTSRYKFKLIDDNGQDKFQRIYPIAVPDMLDKEKRKHWLMVKTSHEGKDYQAQNTDKELIKQIFTISCGNPYLQMALFTPLLHNDRKILQTAIDSITHWQASDDFTAKDDLYNSIEADKIRQRLAFEVYYQSLPSHAKKVLQALSVFDFPVPIAVIKQAGDIMNVVDTQSALIKLDSLGLLLYSDSLDKRHKDPHIVCYGLIKQDIKKTSDNEQLHRYAVIFSYLLWRHWLHDFLTEYKVPVADDITLIEDLEYIRQQCFDIEEIELEQFNKITSLSTPAVRKYIGYLNCLAISYAPIDWVACGITATEFLDKVELSLTHNMLEKLDISFMALFDNLSIEEANFLMEYYIDEEDRLQEFYRTAFIETIDLLGQQFIGREDLSAKIQGKLGFENYRDTVNIANSSQDQDTYYKKLIEDNKNNPQALTSIYHNYANFLIEEFLAGIRKDYTTAEKLYQKALAIDPNDTYVLSSYAIFFHNIQQNYAKSEEYYKKVLKVDPNHTDTLGNYANFFADHKQDYDKAEELFQKAIDSDPSHASHLANYANFLTDIRQGYDKAEKLYQKALTINPNHTVHLANYASFLTDIKQEHKKAEQYYQKALSIEPDNSNVLANYANFLTDVQKNQTKIKKYYQEALEINSRNADNLANYANFLTDVEQEHTEAEKYYKKVLHIDPYHVNNLANYAIFLTDIKQDYKNAEKYYLESLAIDPYHVNNLVNYANFLMSIKQDYTSAEEYLQKALEIDPNNANNLSNCSQLLFIQNKSKQAVKYLNQAKQAFADGDYPQYLADAIELELAFYSYAHCQPHSLQTLKQLLTVGIRSTSLNLTKNVQVAIQFGHPNPKLLADIASVINDNKKIDVLDAHPEWQKCV